MPEKAIGRIISKPLPQILDEMDENIRSAIDATRRTEEAARAAKQAAVDATKAANDAEKRAEEARKAGQMAAETATKAAAQSAAKAEKVFKAAIAASEAAAQAAEESQKNAQNAIEAFKVAIEKTFGVSIEPEDFAKYGYTFATKTDREREKKVYPKLRRSEATPTGEDLDIL
jgi:hypothetical protein